jgi:hypothetical protein
MHRYVVLAALFFAGVCPAAAADTPISPPVATSCADPWVLGRIMERFAWAERHNWHRGFVMASIENPRPGAHPFAEPGIIARDYCLAETVLTNGEIRSLLYTVEYGMGFASVGRGVLFCVAGLDPWGVYGGACRPLR